MITNKKEEKVANGLALEPRQHRAIHKEKKETMIIGIIKAFFYFSLTALVYLGVFLNGQKMLDLLTTKTYTAPIISMTVVVLTAFLLGSGINIIIKHTLERALVSQNLREE